MLLGAGVVLLILIALAMIALTSACSTTPEDQIRSGHNTTFPPLPTCLVFCFSTITSTITSTAEVTRASRPAKSRAASGASAVGVPSPIPPAPPSKQH